MEAVPRKEQVLGVPLSTSVTIDSLLRLCEQHLGRAERERALTITFVNPHAWTQLRRHGDYLDLLCKTDVVLADGIGVALAASRVTRRRTPRISFDFSSLAAPFISCCQTNGWSVGFVGAGPGVCGRAVEQIRQRFPNLEAIDCGDGFRTFAEISNQILVSNVDVVIVGMGAPHQERFIHHLAGMHRGVIFTCGGFLDQSQATLDYYPTWANRWNLRFAYRLAKEPRRLGRRYVLEYLPFLKTCLKGALERR